MLFGQSPPDSPEQRSETPGNREDSPAAQNSLRQSQINMDQVYETSLGDTAPTQGQQGANDTLGGQQTACDPDQSQTQSDNDMQIEETNQHNQEPDMIIGPQLR